MSNRLLAPLFAMMLTWWHTMLNVGVRPGMTFIEARRTKLLNLIALPSIPFISFFAILNFTQQRYVLATVNLLNVFGNVAVLILHQKHRYLSARFFLIIYSIVVYTFSGIYFRNGAEFFLLNILIITLLVYDSNRIRWSISLITIAAFLAIHFLPQDAAFAPEVPAGRAWANVGMSLVFIIIALTYFKQLHMDYLQITENQRKTLAAMNKDKEKMFSIVAHDIRSPLATLEGLLDMYYVGEYSEEDMKEATAILRKKVGQLGDTLDNLLRWSIGQMKGIKAQPVQFELLPLLKEVLDLLDPALKNKNITVRSQLPFDLQLYADRDQANVILRNLLSNALKFSHSGGLISLRADKDGPYVRIEVQDEGIGMNNEQLETLFTFRADPAYGTNGERGTGLGLILCREFASLNHGHLNVKSVLNTGTTFILQLPADSDEDEYDRLPYR